MGNRICGTTTSSPPSSVVREAFAVTIGDVCTADAVTHQIRVNVERTAGAGPYSGWVAVENHPPLSFTSPGGPYVSPAFNVDGALTSVAVSWEINGQFGRIDAVQISGCVRRTASSGPASSAPAALVDTSTPASSAAPAPAPAVVQTAGPASSAAVTDVAAADSLPVTGGVSVPLVLGGVGLVAVGGALVVATRRRTVA